MIQRGPILRLRRAFTLVELLVVITIVLLISGIFLSLSPGNGGGLPAAQQMLASSLRSVRAMALMNRGTMGTGISYNSRYRLLILNDPTDQANHLRQFVIAIGGVNAALATGVDPSTITDTSASAYRWYSPESPSVLPTGIFFIPPKNDKTTTINAPAGGLTADTRRSVVGALLDYDGNARDYTGSPPVMTYATVNQPTSLSSMSAYKPKNWYYIELQPTGSSNHSGRVVLMLAEGVARPAGPSGNVEIDLASDNKFAAISLRPNGDVALTVDADDLNKDALK